MPAIQNNIKEISGILKAMANESRLQIICSLHKGERNGRELIEITDQSQSAISQHLACLRLNKVVSTRRQNQKIYYSLAPGLCHDILQCLHDIYSASDT